jgi:hypothetical protein
MLLAWCCGKADDDLDGSLACWSAFGGRLLSRVEMDQRGTRFTQLLPICRFNTHVFCSVMAPWATQVGCCVSMLVDLS